MFVFCLAFLNHLKQQCKIKYLTLAQPLAVLGRPVTKQIRKTDENPSRVSIIDVAVVITGQDANNAAKALGMVRYRYRLIFL